MRRTVCNIERVGGRRLWRAAEVSVREPAGGVARQFGRVGDCLGQIHPAVRTCKRCFDACCLIPGPPKNLILAEV